MHNRSLAFIILVVAALSLAGCSSKPEEAQSPAEPQAKLPAAPKELFARIPELGLSIKLPAGWKQGKILLDKEDKFAEQEKGRHFFAETKNRYPYGSAAALPKLPVGLSLDQYTSGLSFIKTISKTAKSANGLDAVEIKEEDIDAFKPDEKTPITAMHLYIQDRKGLIWLSYWTESQSFDTYQPDLRKSLDSLVITR